MSRAGRERVIEGLTVRDVGILFRVRKLFYS